MQTILDDCFIRVLVYLSIMLIFQGIADISVW